MANIANLLTEHINIWTAADTEKKSGRGRATSNAGYVYGVKKLRELILELAVRGKLVPQDPHDEPASELLKRIQSEKAKLIAEGKLKKEKPLAAISEEEKPFELPLGWEWVRVGSLGSWGAGATPLRGISSYYGGSMPWFKSGELVSDYIDTAEETVTDLALKECSLRLNQPGDVLLAMYGATIGKASILKVAGTTNQAVCACTPNGSIFNRYLLLMLKAMKANFVGQGAGGAQPNISREKIIATLTALPPLTEQHRIVAKVDELMALCDQLEQQHSNAQEAHKTLVSQLLATLTQSQNATEFNANWQHIYAHFDVLFTTEASIDALKQTLLQLAVMGKLVPQDPNDEPASELLKRIQAKKVKPSLVWLDFNGLEELKKGIPSNWSWVRLGDIADIVRGGSPRPAGDLKFYDGNIPFLKVGDVTRSKGKMVDGFTSTIKPAGLIKTRFINTRTVLLTNSGATLGVPAICDFETTFNDGIAAFINLSSDVFDEYLYLYLKSISAWFLDVAAQGQGQPNLNTDIIRSTWIPVTSLQEQRRIVAKVDVLMALCDQLKTRIQQANQQQQTIADALVAQALLPQSAEVIDFVKYRTTVACYTIKKMYSKAAFGRTQAMKLLYLAQSHVGIPMQMQFEREAAGPLDKWIYEFERLGECEQWFRVVEKSIGFGKTKFEYQIKPAILDQAQKIVSVCSVNQHRELDRLLILFADKNTEEAEIIATLFAAWNDFLIDGKTPSDEEIIKEVRENWHERKARFSVSDLHKSLSWLRRNNLVPRGKSPQTVYQRQLIQ